MERRTALTSFLYVYPSSPPPHPSPPPRYISTTFLSINMSTVGWVGFFSGFTSAAIAAAAAFSVYRIIGIRPEPVHAQAMEILNKDRRVISALGPISYGYFRAGKVKAYMIYQGHFALGDGSRGYVPRTF